MLTIHTRRHDIRYHIFFRSTSQHGHDHKDKMEVEDDLPAWKKRALESGADASAAPFGGSWGAESSTDATK